MEKWAPVVLMWKFVDEINGDVVLRLRRIMLRRVEAVALAVAAERVMGTVLLATLIMMVEQVEISVYILMIVLLSVVVSQRL